ncbi:hypothetical protein G9A89_014513 [Geosiphon pyriformis]|nr:hypothetical protein G9A89_014513 [Geosiphon pyriformis]
MKSISFGEMFSVISSLSNGKAAVVLDMLLVFLNLCLVCVLMNTYFIALIETACKILFKILSDRISSACSEFDVLQRNNFSVLKSMTIQSPIFAIGSVVKDVLEKNRELWLRSLIRIKMCSRFIRFFGSIHNNRRNRVKFSHHFSSAYFMIHLCVRSRGKRKCVAGLTSFFAAGVFIDNTIWIGSSQATTQHILDIASEFFRINDISINNNKTMAIPINCWVETPYLTVIAFVNLVLSWHSHHLLLFLARVSVSSSNNFLADVVHIFFGCYLSLGGSLACAFRCWDGTLMSLVLSKINFLKCVSSLKQYGIAFVKQLHDRNGVVFSWRTFKCWKRLDSHGLIPFWFDLSVCFFGGVASSSACSSLVKNSALFDVCQSHDFGVICDNLLATDAAHLFVYTDGSLSGLRSVAMKAGTAVFFEDINSGLGIGVSGLVSSTISELQTIALALECVPSSHAVDLFSDSQIALDVCKLESLLAHSDFRNCCWIEYCHIANVVCHKNLTVNWIKVKSHSDISGNKHVNELVKDAVLSTWHLPYLVSEHFLRAGSNVVSGNSRHFVCDVFRSILYVHWEVGSGSQILAAGLHNGVNWFKSSLVWHLDSHLAAGFTSAHTAGLQTYFIKSLYHQLSVTVRKYLYDKCYPSMVCLFCGNVEFLDHVFICLFDAASHAWLLDAHASFWETRFGLSQSTLCVSQLLASCFSDATISTTLCKGFVFNDWYYEFFSVFKNAKIVASNIVCFVHKFCFIFCDEFWLVHAKH